MPPGSEKTVRDYLKELRQARGNKPDDVKEALDIYLDLWKKALENGSVEEGEDIADALLRLDKLGGLQEVVKRSDEEEDSEEAG